MSVVACAAARPVVARHAGEHHRADVVEGEADAGTRPMSDHETVPTMTPALVAVRVAPATGSTGGLG